MTQQPAPAKTESPAGRVVDHVVAWSLYAVQLLGEAFLAFFALMSVMMTGSCGIPSQDAAICNVGYFGAVLFGYWGVLVVAAIAMPIVLIVRSHRRRLLWPWALGSLLLLVALTVVFVFLMTR